MGFLYIEPLGEIGLRRCGSGSGWLQLVAKLLYLVQEFAILFFQLIEPVENPLRIRSCLSA